MRKYDLLLLQASGAVEMKLPGTEISIACHSWILAHELPISGVDELVPNRDRIDTKAVKYFKVATYHDEKEFSDELQIALSVLI